MIGLSHQPTSIRLYLPSSTRNSPSTMADARQDPWSACHVTPAALALNLSGGFATSEDLMEYNLATGAALTGSVAALVRKDG